MSFLMVAACWIAVYEDGCRRLYMRVVNEFGESEKCRVRLNLAAFPAWIDEDSLPKTPPISRVAPCTVFGLAIVDFKHEFDVASLWDREERVLCSYCRKSGQAVSLRILDFLSFDHPPREVFHRKALKPMRPSVWFHHLPPYFSRGIVLRSRSGEKFTAGDTLKRYGLSPSDVPCLQVVEPIFKCILANKWSTLMVQGTDPILCSKKPLAFLSSVRAPPRKKQRIMEQINPQCEDAPKATAETLVHIVQNLSRWQSAIVAAAPEEQRDEETLEVVHAIKVLDNLAANRGSNSFSAFINGPRMSKATKSCATVVRCILTMSMLKHRSQLEKVVGRVIRLLPEWCSSMLDPDGLLPSASTLARATLLFDVAMICEWRRFSTTGDWVTFYWADSSKQGDADWLLVQYDYIDKAKLFKCHIWANELWESTARLRELLALEDILSQEHANEIRKLVLRRSDLGMFLKDEIHTHTHVPTSVGGKGAGTLEVKTGKLLHGLITETPPPLQANVPRKLKAVASFTTDMGTELGCADFESNWTDLTEEWRGLRQHEDGIEDDAGAESSAAVDYTSNFVFPEAFVISGLLHIVHNASAETDQHMEKWDWFVAGLSALVHLLTSKDYRDIFIVRCLRESPVAWAEKKFGKSTHSTVEWRWGAALKTIGDILDLKVALRTAWDGDKFLGAAEDRRRDAEQEAAADVGAGPNAREKLNVPRITATINR